MIDLFTHNTLLMCILRINKVLCDFYYNAVIIGMCPHLEMTSSGILFHALIVLFVAHLNFLLITSHAHKLSNRNMNSQVKLYFTAYMKTYLLYIKNIHVLKKG